MREFVYIGRKPCGCVVAAAIDDEENRASTAEDVSEMIRQGYVVERIKRGDALLSYCLHRQSEQPAPDGELGGATE